MREKSMRRDRTWGISNNFDPALTTPFGFFRSAPCSSVGDTIFPPVVDSAQPGQPPAARDYDSVDPKSIVDQLARIEALLQLQIETRETILRAGTLELDLVERTAKRAQRTINLLPREYCLLKYMMQHSDEMLTRSRLLQEVWRYRIVPATNLVDVHMGRLRHKVNGPSEAPMIYNVRGTGFVLRTDS
jgi:DNA-binding winged helix-turn-helix (wHTH) protein